MSFSFLSSAFGFGSSSTSSASTGYSTTTGSASTASQSTSTSTSNSVPPTMTSQNSVNMNSINGIINKTQVQQQQQPQPPPQQQQQQQQRQQQQRQPSIITPPSTIAAQVGTAGVWIYIVLDESGSMSSSQQATITAFNDYIQQQRDAKMEGNVIVSLMKFEGSNIKMVYDRVDLQEVPVLTTQTYVPAGSTNLHDAVGDAMSRIDNKLNESHSLLERSAILFVVLTDGEENASRYYTGARIKEMIIARRAVGWQFIFLGANIEAADVAERMGISRSAAFQCDTHASTGYSSAMQDITTKYRSKCHAVQQVASNHLQMKSSSGYQEATNMLNANLNNNNFDDGTRAKYEAPKPSTYMQKQPPRYKQQSTIASYPNMQPQQQQQQQFPYTQQPTALFPQQMPPPYDQNQMPPPYQPQQQPQPVQQFQAMTNNVN